MDAASWSKKKKKDEPKEIEGRSREFYGILGGIGKKKALCREKRASLR